MSRLLILPSGNTFTHVLECQAIGQQLELLGHDVFYGISKHYAGWAENENLRYSCISELWEKGPTDHPNVSWFIDHDYVATCVQDEIDLIDDVQPDYVLANFKYTSGISARATHTPLISMNILSMLPETQANFGYLPEATSAESIQQQKQLNFFDNFACAALQKVAKSVGLKPLGKMSDYLDGDWVLVPDSPFFQGRTISSLPEHYQPVNFLQLKKTPPWLQALQKWCPKTYPTDCSPLSVDDSLRQTVQQKIPNEKSVLLALGSICRSQEVLVHLISALESGPWKLYVSISGTNNLFLERLKRDFPNVVFASFFNIGQLVENGLDLYVCHGGLGSIYDGLQYAIPTLIIPQQPEQDHNGMLAEQLGGGFRLWPSSPFSGSIDSYKQKLFDTPSSTLRETVKRILDDQSIDRRLGIAKNEFLNEVLSFPDPVQVLQRIITGDTITMVSNSEISAMEKAL